MSSVSVESLVGQLAALNPDEQLMMVRKYCFSIEQMGWEVHYINETSSCGLGEVEGKFVGREETLLGALQDCLDKYKRGWTEKMDWDHRMSQFEEDDSESQQ